MPSVLIAEDNRGTADMLKILLELEGYQVFIVQESQLVLPTLEQQRPDALLMDFFLKEEKATDVLQSIRSQPQFDTLPIVVVSGMEIGWEAEQAGADAFLLKPFNADELLAALQEAMGRREHR